MNTILDQLRRGVRAVMHLVAIGLNRLSGGHLTPNMVTITSLVAHVGIAWLVAVDSYMWAALLLVIFGLFDALDGELARLQNKASASGMLLDASTDRFKEVLLYIGAAYSFVQQDNAIIAVWAVASCGASLCVSYVKAKGETAVAKSHLTTAEVNRLFADGLMRYEIRMALFILGLLFNQLAFAIIVTAISSSLTAVSRLRRITKQLDVQG